MMRSIYKALLRLYPARYTALFGEEMMAVFDRAALDHKSPGNSLLFSISEIAGLFAGAAREWTRRQSTAEAPSDSKARLRFYHSQMIAAIATHDFIAARRYSVLDQRERDRLNRPE